MSDCPAPQYLLPGATEEALANIHLSESGASYIVKETETTRVEVCRMLFNDRIMEVPKSDPLTVTRYWCFPQGSAAVLAALVWDGGAGTEPVGWIKSHDGRYSKEFQQRHKNLS